PVQPTGHAAGEGVAGGGVPVPGETPEPAQPGQVRAFGRNDRDGQNHWTFFISSERCNGAALPGTAPCPPPHTAPARSVARQRFTFTPSCANRNANTSVSSSICSDSAVPPPWPVLALVRSNTVPPGFAACSRAVIFRDCIGPTRRSFAPVRNSTA